MNRFLIVDGSNLLFQMFFGMPARIVNDQGKAIFGTLGFVGALLKIIRKVSPTHIVVLFDGQHENERSGLDPDYKADRIDYSEVPEEENPFSQIDDVYAALDFMGIRHAETTNCETDDMIAAYALVFGKENEIVISSFDSDFFQLITNQVSVLRYRGEKTVICTPEYIKEKFGISRSSMQISSRLQVIQRIISKGQKRLAPKRRLFCLMNLTRWKTFFPAQTGLRSLLSGIQSFDIQKN